MTGSGWQATGGVLGLRTMPVSVGSKVAELVPWSIFTLISGAVVDEGAPISGGAGVAVFTKAGVSSGAKFTCAAG